LSTSSEIQNGKRWILYCQRPTATRIHFWDR